MIRPGTLVKLGGGALLAAYGAVQTANAVIRHREDIDPDAIERPGALFYLRGTGMHLIERGSGPPLLMIHGFGGSTFSFRHQIGPLSAHRRVIALDLPGFGLSDRPDSSPLSHTAQADRLREFIDRMEIERADVLGMSMGGAIALRLAAAYPERVERLLLVATPWPGQPRGVPLYPLSRPLLPVAQALLLARPRALRRRLAGMVYDPTFVTDPVWQGYHGPLRLRGTAAAHLHMIDGVRDDLPLDPATIATRTLLLWGDADPIVPLSVGHRLHATLPDARLEVVPRAGHLVLEEQPAASTAIIERFLATPLPAAPLPAVPR